MPRVFLVALLVFMAFYLVSAQDFAPGHKITPEECFNVCKPKCSDIQICVDACRSACDKI